MWSALALLAVSLLGCCFFDWLNPPGPCLMPESALRARLRRGGGLFEARPAKAISAKAVGGVKPVRGASLALIVGSRSNAFPRRWERQIRSMLLSLKVEQAVFDSRGRCVAVHLGEEHPLDIRRGILDDAGVPVCRSQAGAPSAGRECLACMERPVV